MVGASGVEAGAPLCVRFLEAAAAAAEEEEDLDSVEEEAATEAEAEAEAAVEGGTLRNAKTWYTSDLCQKNKEQSIV